MPAGARNKQALKSISTVSGGKDVQKLSYAWDQRLNLLSRTDALQPMHTTERFRYDPLERITCAYFSIKEDPSAPCALSYDYAQNGNLASKSDVGVLAYNDVKHPHAVTSAGGASYSYNAVGNQTTRPGGMTVTYTPFDVPRSMKQGADTWTFGYDGAERRVRKTTPADETVYMGDLYGRVTEMGSGASGDPVCRMNRMRQSIRMSPSVWRFARDEDRCKTSTIGEGHVRTLPGAHPGRQG